MMEILYVGSL